MFPSAEQDEGTDDDAAQGDAHSHYDACHGPLVQVVEAVGERCNVKPKRYYPKHSRAPLKNTFNKNRISTFSLNVFEKDLPSSMIA